MMAYIKAAAFGVFMMLLIMGAALALLASAMVVGMWANHLGVSKEASALIACLVAVSMLGAGIGVADMRHKRS